MAAEAAWVITTDIATAEKAILIDIVETPKMIWKRDKDQKVKKTLSDTN